MRKIVTIPADGEKLKIKGTGRSVLIESMPIYTEAAQVPIMNLTPGTNAYPLYPRSSYPNEQGKFNSLEIIGTSESAGDEITLLTTLECLALNINIQFTSTTKADFKAVFSDLSTDAVQTLSEAQLSKDGKLPTKIYVAARTNAIAWSYGADPDQSDEGFILAADAEPTPLEGEILISDFRYISAANAQPGNLIVLCEYS